MKLVTWNCCRGAFEVKARHLLPLDADIAVLQEVARPVQESPCCLWFGENPRQGLAVVARPPYHIRRIDEQPNVPKYVIPVQVTGPENFVLFAVWTLGGQPQRYVRAASVAIDVYSELINAQSTVFLGDFNSNAIWDKHHPLNLNHSAMLRRMLEHGLVSAYHAGRSVNHGEETDHTFYHHWNKGKGYHIDFCFVPEPWVSRIENVQVGTYEEWSTVSDHRPLLVELRPAEA